MRKRSLGSPAESHARAALDELRRVGDYGNSAAKNLRAGNCLQARQLLHMAWYRLGAVMADASAGGESPQLTRDQHSQQRRLEDLESRTDACLMTMPSPLLPRASQLMLLDKITEQLLEKRHAFEQQPHRKRILDRQHTVDQQHHEAVEAHLRRLTRGRKHR